MGTQGQCATAAGEGETNKDKRELSALFIDGIHPWPNCQRCRRVVLAALFKRDGYVFISDFKKQELYHSLRN
jgi:hypothetical protein